MGRFMFRGRDMVRITFLDRSVLFQEQQSLQNQAMQQDEATRVRSASLEGYTVVLRKKCLNKLILDI